MSKEIAKPPTKPGKMDPRVEEFISGKTSEEREDAVSVGTPRVSRDEGADVSPSLGRTLEKPYPWETASIRLSKPYNLRLLEFDWAVLKELSRQFPDMSMNDIIVTGTRARMQELLEKLDIEVEFPPRKLR